MEDEQFKYPCHKLDFPLLRGGRNNIYSETITQNFVSIIMANQPTHHAILVGINAYPDRPLNDCVRDVQQIKSLL